MTNPLLFALSGICGTKFHLSVIHDIIRSVLYVILSLVTNVGHNFVSNN
jgi:hypothetical protein